MFGIGSAMACVCSGSFGAGVPALESRPCGGLFVDCGESSRSGKSVLEFPGVTFAMAAEELETVVNSGRRGRWLRSSAGEVIVGGLDGIGICSTVSLEVRPDVDIDKGGGLRLLLMALMESSDDSGDVLRLLSYRFTFRRVDLDSRGFNSSFDGVSPRCNFASTSRPMTCRLNEFFMLLPSLLALLLFTLTFPSITFAGGGGCSIHLVSSLLVGCVLTTGG